MSLPTRFNHRSDAAGQLLQCSLRTPASGTASQAVRKDAVTKEDMMTKQNKLLLIALALVAVKLAIGPIHKFALYNPHDQSWNTDRARTMAHGDWLGVYTDKTLYRSPGYPIFLVVCDLLPLPQALIEQVLYTAACGIFVFAISPLGLSSLAKLSIFAVMLFDPVTTTYWMQQYRAEGLCLILTILMLASGIGFFLRPSWRWALLLGISLGWFWVTREESMWIVPALTILLLLSRSLTVLLVPAIASLIVAGVCFMNYQWYGVWEISELRAGPFASACGALQRVKPADHMKRRVFVQKETRERVYAVSPTFRAVKRILEGEQLPSKEDRKRLHIGTWQEMGRPDMDPEDRDTEVASVLFFPAFRDAVQVTFNCQSSKEAMAVYQRIADEINASCDDGRLEAWPRRDTLRPVLQPGQASQIAAKFFEVLVKLPAKDWHDRALKSSERYVSRWLLGPVYRVLVPILVVIAVGFFLLRFHKLSWQTLVALFSILTALVCRLGLVAFLDVTCFPAYEVDRFLYPCQALLLMFASLTIALSIEPRRRFA